MTNTIKLKKPVCIFFDVDGVLTNGSKFYSSSNGDVIGKAFNDIDFTAFKILKCLNIDFYWISGDNTVNSQIAKKRNIKFIYTRENNRPLKKDYFIKKICSEKNYNLKDVWFIGDDFFDLSAIISTGFSFCVENSFDEIKKQSNYVIPRKSGEYIAAWLVDFLINNLNLVYPSEDEIAKQESTEIQEY